MRYVFSIFVTLLISTAAMADPCGVNCYTFDINGDNRNDKIEFVQGFVSQANQIYSLVLRVSLSKPKTTIVAHDHVTNYVWANVETLVTDSAELGKTFVLTVAENSKLAVVQWTQSDGSLATASYDIKSDGKLSRIK